MDVRRYSLRWRIRELCWAGVWWTCRKVTGKDDSPLALWAEKRWSDAWRCR